MRVKSLKYFDGISCRIEGNFHQSKHSLDEMLDSSSSEIYRFSVLVNVHKPVTQQRLNYLYSQGKWWESLKTEGLGVSVAVLAI